MSNSNNRGSMPIPERAKRFLASFSKYGGTRRAASFRKLGEMEQCKVAGSVLGDMLRPDSSGVYYLTCPGVQFHSNKAGRKDCRFTPGDHGGQSRTAAPSLNCVHQSCGAIIEEMNKKIRSACGKESVEYITDHGSALNNAAAALLIGFDLSAAKTTSLLAEWNKGCTPTRSPSELKAAVISVTKAKAKHPAEVGYLLKSVSGATAARPAGTPSSPFPKNGPSFASANELGGKPVYSNAPSVPSEPVYIGVRGRVAKEARAQIESFTESYGYAPTSILVGPDQPANLPTKLCGLPVERMNTPGISVHGGSRDGYDG